MLYTDKKSLPATASGLSAHHPPMRRENVCHLPETIAKYSHKKIRYIYLGMMFSVCWKGAWRVRAFLCLSMLPSMPVWPWADLHHVLVPVWLWSDAPCLGTCVAMGWPASGLVPVQPFGSTCTMSWYLCDYGPTCIILSNLSPMEGGSWLTENVIRQRNTFNRRH